MYRLPPARAPACPFIFRQQRRVDIEHPARPTRNELRESRRIFPRARHTGLSLAQFRTMIASNSARFQTLVLCPRWGNTLSAGELQPLGPRIIQATQYDLVSGSPRFGGIDQSRHVGTAPLKSEQQRAPCRATQRQPQELGTMRFPG